MIADLTRVQDPDHVGAPFMLYHLLPGHYELRVDLGTIQLAGDGPSATIDVRVPVDRTQESVEGIVVKIDREREIRRIVAELQKD